MARSGQTSTKKKGQAAGGKANFEIIQVIPEGHLSTYVNHGGIQCRSSESHSDVTFTFWQIPAHGMDLSEGKASAFLVGSFVMTREFAKVLLQESAKQLGMEITEKTEADDAG